MLGAWPHAATADFTPNLSIFWKPGLPGLVLLLSGFFVNHVVASFYSLEFFSWPQNAINNVTIYSFVHYYKVECGPSRAVACWDNADFASIFKSNISVVRGYSHAIYERYHAVINHVA
jgi:hypothetical protein